VQKSQKKQFFLTALFGPLGLFYINIKVALSATLVTLCVLYKLPQYILYIVPVSFVASALLGVWLTGIHNKRTVKDFRLQTYIGRVSCNVTGTESIDKEYHQTLRKVRRKKLIRNLEIYALSLLCLIVSGVMLKPHLPGTISLSKWTKPDVIARHDLKPQALQSETINPIHSDNNQPVWIHKNQGNHTLSALPAISYEKGSAGYYKPNISIECKDTELAFKFIVDEILGTENTVLDITIDSEPSFKAQWALSSTYRTAISRDADSMINLLRSAEKLSISFTPFEYKGSKTAAFYLNTNSATISNLLSKCKTSNMPNSLALGKHDR